MVSAALLRIFAALAALASSSAAFAQSCPACYQNAAAQAPGMLHALRAGVLVMMFPSLLMFIMIFGVLFRRRNNFNSGVSAEEILLAAAATEKSPGDANASRKI